MPSSSISISPTPDSCTILTSSRIRSARVASTSPSRSDASREWRWRIDCSSVSASSPNMASRTRSSSLAASPSAASRTSSALGGSSSSPPPLPVTSATARETDSSIGAGVVP